MAGKRSSALMNLVSSSDEEAGPRGKADGIADVVVISSDSDSDVPPTKRGARGASAPEPNENEEAGGDDEVVESSSEGSSSSEGEIPEDAPVRRSPRSLLAERQTGEEANDAESSDDEDGEVDGKAAQRSIRAEISAQMRSAGKDVAERDARFFSLQNVVCSYCGTKGHLSYDCPEEVAAKRCFLCGREGHSSRKCPDEECFLCRRRGHRAADCPNKDGGGKRAGSERDAGGPPKKARRWSPPRFIAPLCYVCGSRKHNDCSLSKMPLAELSCYNCGHRGHSAGGCREPKAERYARVARDLDIERKNSKKSGRKSKRDPNETEEQKQKREKEKEDEILKDKLDYRKELEFRVRGAGRQHNNSKSSARGDRDRGDRDRGDRDRWGRDRGDRDRGGRDYRR